MNQNYSLNIGVDPGGTSGAICLVYRKDGKVIDVCFYRFSKHTDAYIMELAVKLRLWVENTGAKCFGAVEKVHAMPKQGVSSAFSFGQNYGLCLAFMAVSKCPYDLITPRTWQKVFVRAKKKTETKSDHKRNLQEVAQRQYPNVQITLSEADALLLAHFSHIKK